jgi:hypothetical protein
VHSRHFYLTIIENFRDDWLFYLFGACFSPTFGFRSWTRRSSGQPARKNIWHEARHSLLLRRASRPWKKSLAGKLKDDLERSAAFSAAARVNALEKKLSR